MLGVINTVRESLLLQVVGVDHTERYLSDLLHQLTHHLHTFVTLTPLTPAQYTDSVSVSQQVLCLECKLKNC